MKIGIAGPASLGLLKEFLPESALLPQGYEFPQASYIITELIAQGHEVALFTLDATTKEPRVIKGDGLTLHIGRYRARHRARDLFAVERRDLIAAIRSENCDVIHAQWTYEFAMATLTSGKPCLITVHDWAPTILRLMPNPYRFIRLLMNWYVLRHGRDFTVPSPYIQTKLAQATSRQYPIIPNAIPNQSFTTVTREPSTGPRILLSVNNGFSKLKNVGTLIEAFTIVRSKVSAAQLWLVGSGFESSGPAARWARQRGLVDGIRFLGAVSHPEVLGLMRKADVLVHTSLEESFGMILIEAMAQRTPVVAGSTSGAVPWVLGNGQAGVLTNVQSASTVATDILRLIQSDEIWKAYSEGGYLYAKERFHLSEIVRNYVAEYQRLLGVF